MYTRAAFAKRKRNKAVCPNHNHEVRESQGEQEPHLGKREEDQSWSIDRKGWTSQRRKAGSKEEREGKEEEPP